MERTRTVSVVVIGAGIGGMCTAARLARQGHDVTVFESSAFVGGKCRTEWIGKYAFDLGPSLLTIPAVYRDFFQKTGKHLGQVISLTPVDPSFDYRFTDGTSVKFANLSHHKTHDAIAESLGEDAAAQWSAMMKRAERMWDVSREPFVESELRSIFSLLKRFTLLRDLFIITPWKSLRDFANELLPNQKLRYILDRYATYSGSDPRSAPAVLSTIAFIEEAFGAWHIEGGIGNLSTAVHQRCVDLGVKFELNSPVQSINTGGRKVSGITLADGRVIDADIVVANTDAGLVYNKLISGKRFKLRGARARIKKSTPSFSGFSLLLGLRADDAATPLSHHTILFPENYDEEFNSLFQRKAPVQDPTIYICAPTDASMTKDPGARALSILVNAPRHDPTGVNGFNWDNPEFVRKYANQIIDTIESRGISIRDRLDVFEVRTPSDLEKSVNAPGGSIYGTSSNGARAAFLRASNRSPLKGLYLVGGSAHPGGGLPLVGLSAEMVASAIGSTRNAAPGLH